MAFADLLSTVALVTRSEANAHDTVILKAAPHWTNSLDFADLMSTVAVVTGFRVWVVGTVTLPVAFWSSDSRKEIKIIMRLIFNQRKELSYVYCHNGLN